MQIYLNFSSDQIFSIGQTAEITSKKIDKQNYMNFHKVSGETTIFVRPKVQARLHFLKKLQEVSGTV